VLIYFGEKDIFGGICQLKSMGVNGGAEADFSKAADVRDLMPGRYNPNRIIFRVNSGFNLGKYRRLY